MKLTHKSNITLPEIFEMVNAKQSQDEKLDVLNYFKKTKQLKWFCDKMYNVDFTGYYIPEYKPNENPNGLCYGNIGKQTPRLDAAIKLFKDENTKRYDAVMTLVLESVTKEEAKLIENLFSNKKINGISKALWKRVYPEFFRIEV